MQTDVQYVDADPPLSGDSAVLAKGDAKEEAPSDVVTSTETAASSCYQVIDDKPGQAIEGKHDPRKTKKKKKGVRGSIVDGLTMLYLGAYASGLACAAMGIYMMYTCIVSDAPASKVFYWFVGFWVVTVVLSLWIIKKADLDIRLLLMVCALLTPWFFSIHRSWHPDAGKDIVDELVKLRRVEPLIAHLHNQDASIRCKAAEGLVKLGDMRALEPLTGCLKDNNENVRRLAAESLLGLGYSPSTAKAKIDLLVARGAWDEIFRLGEEAVEPLISCLKDNNDNVRRKIVEALGKLRDPRAVEPLIACLQDANTDFRCQVVEALRRLGDPRAVEPLIACLQDANTDFRCQVAEAFSRLGDKRAVPNLVALLPDWPVNAKLVEALKRLDWKPATELERLYCHIAERNTERLLEDWEQNKRLLSSEARSRNRRKVENAVHTIIALEKREMIPDLVTALDSCDDKSIVLFYLNSDSKELNDAAREWASKRGYSVIRTPGRSGSSWGRW